MGYKIFMYRNILGALSYLIVAASGFSQVAVAEQDIPGVFEASLICTGVAPPSGPSGPNENLKIILLSNSTLEKIIYGDEQNKDIDNIPVLLERSVNSPLLISGKITTNATGFTFFRKITLKAGDEEASMMINFDVNRSNLQAVYKMASTELPKIETVTMSCKYAHGFEHP